MSFSTRLAAHFHAIYGEHEALIEIETLMVFRGSLPRRALALVLEWAALHRAELRERRGRHCGLAQRRGSLPRRFDLGRRTS
jgi:hypothetical protein